MKVYFINPPAMVEMSREGRCMVKGSAWTFTLPPISLANCAAILREKGFEVKISDCIAEEIDFFNLGEKIRRYNPDLIIFNTATPSINKDLKVAKIAKKISNEIKVGAIGIHPSCLTTQTFSLSRDLDYILKGEPEFTVRDLALSLKNNHSLSKVEGLSYRINDKIIHNPSRKFIENLDTIPFPAWDLIDVNKYRMPFTNKPFLLVSPSRGCPYQCIFCNSQIYYGEKLRLRSPQRIGEEIEWVKTNFKVDSFLFWTESFTLNKEFVMKLAEEILKKNLKIEWTCNSRVDSVDLELLQRMKESGCWMVGFGVESGNQKILNYSKKSITLKQSIDAVKLTQKAGMEVSAQFIIGLPGETKKTALETLSFAKKLNADYVQFYCAVPFPGSKLYKMAAEKEWINSNDWSKFNQDESVLDMKTLSGEEVMKLRKKAYLSYYLRPQQVFKTLKKIKSLSEFKNFLYMVKKFFNWI